MSPVSSSAWSFSSSVLPIAAELGHPALARERHDRHGGLAHGLGRGAVGDHAVGDGAVELVEVPELVEGGGDLCVREVGHRQGSSVRRRCPVPSGSSSRPTTRPRRSRASSLRRGPRSPAEDLAPARRRRRLARRHRRARRAARRGARVDVLHRPAKLGLGHAPTSPASRHALARGRGAGRASSTPTARTTPPPPAAARRSPAATRTSCSARATCPAAAIADWAPAARRASRARGCAYARAVLRVPVRDLTGGFKGWRARGAARRSSLADGALAGLRVPGRADLPRAAARPARRRDRRSCSASAARARPRCRRGSRSRRRGSCRRCAHPSRPRAADLKEHERRRTWPWSRDGPTPARRCGAGARARPRRCCRGRSASLAIAALLLAATWVIAIARRPTRPAGLLPRPRRHVHARRLRLHPLPQRLVLALHGFACVAGFMAGSSLPLRSPRATRGSGAGSTTRPARSRSASSSLRDAVLARHAGVGARQRRRRRSPAQLGISPALLLLGLLAARGAGAVRALPAARRLDRSPAAAAAWNELLAATFVTVAIAIRSSSPPLRRGLGLAARAARLAGRPRAPARPSLYFLKRNRRTCPKGATQWPTSTRSPTPTSRPRCSRPTARARRLLGAVVRARAAWSPRSSRRSPASAPS